ncbi:hypothetical protein Pyn_37357 [Prunus yedoensis var. nudiflora]|uniref:Uncharacterized protein n=1 Tax=Prunus yedoensis var. nudiflora TaxID=2094558 RepID=A0A314ZEJ1_PRUYE|nr:hypothetical protein Pyn_37357 [Prunus yedoensis var. nudiflora]
MVRMRRKDRLPFYNPRTEHPHRPCFGYRGQIATHGWNDAIPYIPLMPSPFMTLPAQPMGCSHVAPAQLPQI